MVHRPEVGGGICLLRARLAFVVASRVATWGPAVIGRVDINFSDPDLHAPSTAGAVRFIQNNVTWLSGLGATEEVLVRATDDGVSTGSAVMAVFP